MLLQLVSQLAAIAVTFPDPYFYSLCNTILLLLLYEKVSAFNVEASAMVIGWIHRDNRAIVASSPLQED